MIGISADDGVAMYHVSEKSHQIVKNGAYKARVLRGGMYQQFTFTVKKSMSGNIEYTVLYTKRMVDISELMRIAEEAGLPVESENGKAFPKGSAALDFQNL